MLRETDDDWRGSSGAEPGYSGGPVFDIHTRRLIGMVVSAQHVNCSFDLHNGNENALEITVPRLNPSIAIIPYIDNFVQYIESLD